ncbi:hypothetical protein BCU83_05010 [Vibrio breoganii]|uniref:DUF3087 domain-containing protein n=1 Tax=Vibrio breoganii TaxID=553239 RepID=A0AAN0XZ26_9VIBR|nr:DUF3087 domain-containing protein [Vibrio breoganii]ANO35079.1 hypothetical protein A6E01_18065 [Vibrio breoganii]MDN3715467.1 DUF3087 domain-containing protein [Vibrio breoganii]OED83951.1 hypothetical protein A1QE_13405 [Vibrio breoganii ZF-55]PMG83334.1 hypothetical protein BCU83_05010 [Vibrio breoganii]PMK45231.1 hypothetical protein BCU00_00870 [Vibrio breoganii]
MQLKEIDKKRYRSRLNVVIVACIVSLAVLSLSISQTLIYLFPSEAGSHFHWNLLGVVVSAIAVGMTLRKLKSHPKMFEVAYIWDLKHQLNLIYRKNRKLLAAAEQGNKEAMLALQFSYQGSRQLWQMDDNTITMSSLNTAQNQLDKWVEEYDVQLDISDYHSGLLKEF